MDTLISFGPLFDILYGFLSVALMTVGSWAIAWLGKRFKLAADAEIRGYLETALESGIAWALREIRARGETIEGIHTDSALIEKAAEYVIDKVPDALDHFGIDDGALAELIAARLPVVS